MGLPGRLLAGGWLLPARAAGVWTPDPTAPTFTFDAISQQWATVDGLYRYRALEDRFDVLAGFRWDRKKAKLHYSDDTDDVYTLDTYAPLLGLQVNQPAAGGVISARGMGSPLTYGSMKYRFWDNFGFTENGDFPLKNGAQIELRAQYSHPVGRRLQLGGFLQWNRQWVHSKEVALSGSTSERVSWDISNEALTVGVTVAFGRNPSRPAP
ncbi:MAG: hypothetical protein PHF00_11400 [Elusimicrobia bacterium]|nr:hypothetical protein [Elusimicrobiota bacterium]